MPTTSSNQAGVTLENVTLRINDTLMFEHTNWDIRPNEHWAILGPNGAGKSILANALRRKVPVAHGRILYYFENVHNTATTPRSYLKRGEVVGISSDTQRDMLRTYGGYHQARWQSFEGRAAPTVADLLTGKSIEHISPYEISPLCTDEAVYRQRRDHAIALLGIAYLLNRKIFHISHGEGRKVLLARALMQQPKLLILDDPFCGLDTESRQHLVDIINDIITLNATQIVLAVARPDHIPERITHIAHVDRHQITTTMLNTLSERGKGWVAESDTTAELFPYLTPSHNTVDLSPEAAVKELPPGPLSSQERGPGGEFFLKSTVLPPSQERKGLMREFWNNTELLRSLHQQSAAIAPGSPLIEMRNVSVSYGDVQVLQNLTWSMLSGEQWAIMGDNGAGKTTLLSLILADNPRAYANDITLFGRRRGSGESIWDIKRHIGWVSPELLLYHQSASCCLTVVESGFFDTMGLYRQCTADQTALANSWMEALGIHHLAKHALGAVSAGEQRMVFLARALVKSPILLVMDEPCQGLDQYHREHILYTLDALCAHTAVHLIYVTHYQHEMPTAITHSLHLAHGRIQQIRSPKENFL